MAITTEELTTGTAPEPRIPDEDASSDPARRLPDGPGALLAEHVSKRFTILLLLDEPTTGLESRSMACR